MLRPMMTDAEAAMLEHYLGQSRRYLEFGCGGSTFSALASPSIEKIWSVESSAAWLVTMRGHAEIATAEAQQRLSLVHVDIGPTMEFGYPVDEAAAARWPAYSTEIWTRLPAADLDTVLIDGRFRTACALQSTAHCGPIRLIVHDFWDRPQYGAIAAFARVVDRVDTLAVLTPLPDNDWRAFALALSAHSLDPR